MSRPRLRAPPSRGGDMVAPMSPTDGADAELPAPDTMLVRAQDVLVRLTNEDEVGIDLDGERYLAPRVALNVLDAFSVPRYVKDVLASLPSSGPEHYVELATCIEDLADRGILIPPESRGEEATRGWVRPNVHLLMLDDRARTKGFCDALRKVVKPEDVVVDIGTGTGVLATCAALAGARQVYAVESSGIAEVAARMFAANSVSERVQLVRRRSTSATLPELASVLVTETIGNDPLDEQLLEIVADAKHRLLAPGARIIPAAIQIYAIAVDIPRTLLEKHVFTKRKLDGYRAEYEMDFSVLADHQLSSTEPIMVDSRDVARAGHGLARHAAPRHPPRVPREAGRGHRPLDAPRRLRPHQPLGARPLPRLRALRAGEGRDRGAGVLVRPRHHDGARVQGVSVSRLPGTEPSCSVCAATATIRPCATSSRTMVPTRAMPARSRFASGSSSR